MKDRKNIVHLLCQLSESLSTTYEQHQIIQLAASLNLIYGQIFQIDLDGANLKLNGITFAEYGVGAIILNSLTVDGEIEHSRPSVAKH